MNESLEKKYPVYEEKRNTLTEAFDESMPKWLANRIAYNNLKSGNSPIKVERGVKGTPNKGTRRVAYGGWRDSDVINRKYPEHGPDYVTYKKSSKTGESGEDLNLANQLRKAGIDLSKVKIIEAPVPSIVPKKSKKRIDIFGMDNGQVWARGVNDREEFGNHTFKKYVKDFPDNFLSHVIHYAYIDTSDPAVGAYADIKEKRLALKQELQEIGNYNRVRNDPYGNFDKSGYRVTPTSKKYKSALDKIKFSKIEKTFEEIASRIEDIKYALITALNEIDLTDSHESYRVFKIIRDATDDLQHANTDYLGIVDFINGESFDPKESYTLSYVMNEIRDVEIRLSRAEEGAKEYIKTVADW